MKKIYLFLFAMCGVVAYAAGSDYTPLVQEGRVWVYAVNENRKGADSICMMEFKGDTIINDTVFKKLYFYDNKKLASPQWPIGYMCEIDKKVYAMSNNRMSTSPYNATTVVRNTGGEVILMYDFNDILSSPFHGMLLMVTPYVDQVEIEGKMCNRGVWPDEYIYLELIEGIGPNCLGMTLIDNSTSIKYYGNDAMVVGLKYVKNANGEIIFKGRAYKETNPAAVVEIAASKAVDSNVYTIDGRIVKQNATDLSGLAPGIYIFQGKKQVQQ